MLPLYSVCKQICHVQTLHSLSSKLNVQKEEKVNVSEDILSTCAVVGYHGRPSRSEEVFIR